MNARQSLKLASQKIENMGYTLFCNKADIKEYNRCIEGMIRGESPCPFCNEYAECMNEEKDGKGCSEWLLKIPQYTMADVKQEDENAGEGLNVVGSKG